MGYFLTAMVCKGARGSPGAFVGTNRASGSFDRYRFVCKIPEVLVAGYYPSLVFSGGGKDNRIYQTPRSDLAFSLVIQCSCFPGNLGIEGNHMRPKDHEI
jgi:hypothetical protein